MPLISCSLWISVYMWSSLKMKSVLIKTNYNMVIGVVWWLVLVRSYSLVNGHINEDF